MPAGVYPRESGGGLVLVETGNDMLVPAKPVLSEVRNGDSYLINDAVYIIFLRCKNAKESSAIVYFG
jgi:hypothetical protein